MQPLCKYYHVITVNAKTSKYFGVTVVVNYIADWMYAEGGTLLYKRKGLVRANSLVLKGNIPHSD
jgi:hypothetical protein